MMPRLTQKQHSFALAYIESGNATEAAERAGYKARNRNTLGSIGTELLAKSQVIAFIEKERARVAEVTEITLERMTRNLADLAFSPRVEPRDRITASRELNRMYGLYAKDNSQLMPVVFNIGYDYDEDDGQEQDQDE